MKTISDFHSKKKHSSEENGQIFGHLIGLVHFLLLQIITRKKGGRTLGSSHRYQVCSQSKELIPSVVVYATCLQHPPLRLPSASYPQQYKRVLPTFAAKAASSFSSLLLVASFKGFPSMLKTQCQELHSHGEQQQAKAKAKLVQKSKALCSIQTFGPLLENVHITPKQLGPSAQIQV